MIVFCIGKLTANQTVKSYRKIWMYSKCWEDMWLMSFNATKCNTMLVTLLSKPISFSYSIHNTTIGEHSLHQIPRCYHSIKHKMGRTCHTGIGKGNKVLKCPQTEPEIYQRGPWKGIQITCKTFRSNTLHWFGHPGLAKDKVQLEQVQCQAACYVCNTYNRHSSVTDMLNRAGMGIIRVPQNNNVSVHVL